MALVAGGLLTIASGCSSSESNSQNALVFADFEQFEGWVPPSQSLTTDVAHSGTHAIRAGKDIDYSLTYIRPLGVMSAKRFRKVKLTAWAYLTDASAGGANLSFALHDPQQQNQQIFSVNFPLNEQVKSERKWEQVSREITLPANADFGHEVRLFLWKASASSYAYLDDLRVEVVE